MNSFDPMNAITIYAYASNFIMLILKLVLGIISIYALTLLIKALKIYINKNKE